MRVASDTRWTWIFATVGLLVVLVVIGFLIGITNALDSIDDGLAEADSSVTDIRGNARPLPDHVQEINSNLTRIDRSLQPIPGQATDILGSLTSIDRSLTSVNGALGTTTGSLTDTSGSLVDTSGTLQGVAGSLTDTSGSLVDTSGSLRGTSGTLRTIAGSLSDTSGVLVNVGSLVSRINTQLRNAQRRGSLGTAEIPIRVATANGVLGPAEEDAGRINTGLTGVNRHLVSICQSNVLRLPVPTQVSPSSKC
jgi:methyl-accepting chemotaxis protein